MHARASCPMAMKSRHEHHMGWSSTTGGWQPWHVSKVMMLTGTSFTASPQTYHFAHPTPAELLLPSAHRAEMSPHQLAHWGRLRCTPANFRDRYTGRQSARRWCTRSSYPGTWTGDAWPHLTGWPLYARHMAQGTRKGALWFRPRGTSPASAPDWVIKGQSFTSVYIRLTS